MEKSGGRGMVGGKKRREDIGGKRMKNKIAILLILAVCLSIVISFAAAQEAIEPDCPSGEACALWGVFKEKYGKSWSVRWDNLTSTPIVAYGYTDLNLGDIITEDKAKEVALAFISENKELLKVDDLSNLVPVRTEKGETIGGWYVSYQQLYQGIPVHGGKIGLTLSNKSEVLGFGSTFYSNISLSTTPVISENESIEIAKDEARSLGST
ncbi:MAG: hypothetical protein V3R93_02105, partial [Candidatus Hydrothermarchaeaceae archaeon]